MGNGNRPVDLETFVVGCIKLQGMARSMDLMDVMLSQRKAHDEIRGFMLYCRRQFRNLRALQQLKTELDERSDGVSVSNNSPLCIQNSVDASLWNFEQF